MRSPHMVICRIGSMRIPSGACREAFTGTNPASMKMKSIAGRFLAGPIRGGDRLPTGTADSKLWYERPAEDWETEALPIGNGRIGCMVFGGVPKERIQFNEDTLWIGEEKETGAYQAGQVWLNGHNLGETPQKQPMHLPECWLQKGANELVILDLDGTDPSQVSLHRYEAWQKLRESAR